MKIGASESGTTSNRTVALGMLVLIYMSSYLDRQILSILLPQIKAEFRVPDTYLGLLSGLAFAVLYTLLGVPLARVADNHSRVNLLTICIAAWSLMTALCGMAATFFQLVAARIGVGIGEAGCNPAAHSLISDYFPFERRASALATYAIAVPLGSLLGLALGGWLGEKFGWRVAFMVVGLPGVLLAVLVKWVMKEPLRGMSDGTDSAAAGAAPPFGEAIRYLWQTKTFRALCAAAAADAFVGYGLLLWLPTYLIRSFALTPSETGLRLGLMVGITGVIGALGVGFLADRLGKKDRRFYCWMPAMVAGIALAGNVAVYSSMTVMATFILLVIPLIALPASGGPVYAAVQSIAPPRMRATAASVLLLVLNLVGLGLGPAFVGLMSDMLADDFGTDSLRIAMLTTAGVYFVSMTMAYLASRFFIRDLDRVEAIVAQTRNTIS
jgi:MFS family permease